MNRTHFQSIVRSVASSLLVCWLMFMLVCCLVAPLAARAAPATGTEPIVVTAVEDIGKVDPANPYDLARWQASFSNDEACHASMDIYQSMPALGEVQAFRKPWWGFGGIIQFTDAAGVAWTCNP